MEVKPGYKQSEVGVIPEDWRVASIEDIATVGRGRVISQRDIARAYNSQYPIYSSQTSDDGVMGYIDTFDFEGEYVTWTTDGANAGTVFARNGRFNCTNVCGTIKLRTDNHIFVARVLGRLAPRHVSRHLGNPKLMNDIMKRIKIPLPWRREEQDAIAEALSDVDGLLSGLDRLITKKRDLKQAAMQQLLTGQTRLPGFHGEWEVKRFGEIAFPRRERVDPRRTGVHDFCIELEHIESGSGRILGSTSTGTQSSLKSVFYPGDVLFGKLRAYLRKYWRATRHGVCSTEIWVLVPRSDAATSEFLFQLVQTDGFIDAASNSYGTHMPRSDWNAVQNCKLKMPPVPEQTAIAEVLLEMDAELAALDQRREKTRLLKQAMMQELLTGKTRLVQTEAAHA